MRCSRRSVSESLLGGLGRLFRRGLTGFGRWRFSRRLRRGAGRLAGGGLGGFLARFLGHTPSFRRFRRINHVSIAGLAPACRNQTDCWASLMALEYGYKEFDARPVGSLNAFLGPDEKLQY